MSDVKRYDHDEPCGFELGCRGMVECDDGEYVEYDAYEREVDRLKSIVEAMTRAADTCAAVSIGSIRSKNTYRRALKVAVHNMRNAEETLKDERGKLRELLNWIWCWLRRMPDCMELQCKIEEVERELYGKVQE